MIRTVFKCGLAALLLGTARAERAIVYATDDAMAVGNALDTNYGDSGSMYIRHQNATWGNNRSLAKFDLSGIPRNANITSAQMRFYMGLAAWPDSPAHFAPVAIFKNTAGWDESTVTFNTAPAHDSFPLVTVETFFSGAGFAGTNLIERTTQEWLQFSGASVVDLVQGWVDGSQDNYGVTMAATGEYLPDGRIFSLKTKDHSTEAVRPYLVVDYTLAEPSASSGLVFSILSESAGAEVPQAEAFLDKAARGMPVTVAYLGGSITRGASVWPVSGTDAEGNPFDFRAYDAERDSWRALSFAWLRSQYEKTPGQFRQVNAAIGGTPSLLGAYRLEQDVLSQNPDLVFVEFAVNDSYAAALTENNPDAPGSIFRTSRSIVDRLRAQNPDVLVFMPLSTHRVLDGSAHTGWSEALDRGHDQMHLAAEMLGVPYVSIKKAFEESRPAGQDPFYGGIDTAGNYVHPAPEGHRAYAETVQNALQALFQTGRFEFGETVESVAAYPVSPALILPETLASFCEGWQVAVPATVEAPVLAGHSCLIGDDASGALEYTFTGSAVGLWMDNQSQGSVEVHLDGIRLGTFSGRFNSLSTSLDSATPHAVRLMPSAGSRIFLRALTLDGD